PRMLPCLATPKRKPGDLSRLALLLHCAETEGVRARGPRQLPRNRACVTAVAMGCYRRVLLPQLVGRLLGRLPSQPIARPSQLPTPAVETVVRQNSRLRLFRAVVVPGIPHSQLTHQA